MRETGSGDDFLARRRLAEALVAAQKAVGALAQLQRGLGCIERRQNLVAGGKAGVGLEVGAIVLVGCYNGAQRLSSIAQPVLLAVGRNGALQRFAVAFRHEVERLFAQGIALER